MCDRVLTSLLPLRIPTERYRPKRAGGGRRTEKIGQCRLTPPSIAFIRHSSRVTVPDAAEPFSNCDTESVSLSLSLRLLPFCPLSQFPLRFGRSTRPKAACRMLRTCRLCSLLTRSSLLARIMRVWLHLPCSERAVPHATAPCLPLPPPKCTTAAASRAAA